MTILAILQARYSSSRFPGKCLEPILDVPMFARQIERLRRSARIEHLVVATSGEVSDDRIEALCLKLGVSCFRGALDDVLDRFVKAAAPYDASHIVRLTGDCPLADPTIIDRIIQSHLREQVDYTSNTIPPTWPDGLDVEVVRSEALEEAAREARFPSDREHVTQFVVRQPDRYKLSNVYAEIDRSHMRWTVDEPADLQFVREIYRHLYPVNNEFLSQEIFDLMEGRPELEAINGHITRNEGLNKAFQADPQDKPS